jgi:hypothetical protein
VRLASYLAALLLLGGGAAAAPTPSATPLLTARGVILSGSIATPVFTQCSRPAPRDAAADWTPSIDEIARLEERLPAFVSGLGDHGPSRPLGEYRRQYVGFSRGAHRYIYVNAFRRDLSDDDPRPEYRDYWQRAAVVVCDGGDAFFGVEYDVEAGRFGSFAANGPYRPRK